MTVGSISQNMPNKKTPVRKKKAGSKKKINKAPPRGNKALRKEREDKPKSKLRGKQKASQLASLTSLRHMPIMFIEDTEVLNPADVADKLDSIKLDTDHPDSFSQDISSNSTSDKDKTPVDDEQLEELETIEVSEEEIKVIESDFSEASDASFDTDIELTDTLGFGDLSDLDDDNDLDMDAIRDYEESASEIDEDDMLKFLGSSSMNYEMDPFDAKDLEYSTVSDLPPAVKPYASERQKMKRMAHKLINSGNYTPPLWERYPEVIKLIDMVKEIEYFIEQDHDEPLLAFPPLGKEARNQLELMASHYKLGFKEKKRFAEYKKHRYVLLSKTSQSNTNIQMMLNPEYHSYTYARKDASASVRKNHIIQRGSLRSARAVEGETVGAAAAEIHETNFGHQLMKKMGWTKGMGLGKDGSGCTLPVPAKVKVTRSGLGR